MITLIPLSLDASQLNTLITRGSAAVDPSLTPGMMKHATDIVFLGSDGQPVQVAGVKFVIDPTFRQGAQRKTKTNAPAPVVEAAPSAPTPAT